MDCRRSEIALHGHESANISVHINVGNNDINDQHQEHINNAPPSWAVGADNEQEEESFQANDPHFKPAHDTKGVDVGKKVVSLLYKAEKSVVERRRRITYNQCSSKVQTVCHIGTAHLSHQRTKHISFVFDFNLDPEFLSKFPATIRFYEFKSVIHQLGGDYECHRRKFTTKNFSVYLYVVKTVGVRFSERGRRDWGNLLMWGDSLQDPTTEKDVKPKFSETIGEKVVAGALVHAAVATIL